MVLYMVDAAFGVIADGDSRKIEHPKKKRLKHLTACPYEAPELIERYEKGQLKDSDIRKVLFPIIEKNGARAPESMREG